MTEYTSATIKHSNRKRIATYLPALPQTSGISLENWAKTLMKSNDFDSIRLHAIRDPERLDPDYEVYRENGHIMTSLWSNSD